MKFGPVPLAEAHGAILAHGLKLPDLALRKGRVLTVDDLESLTRSGIETIVVAKPECGDVGEDEAAARLARRLIGENLTASAAFTGRVNIYAAAAGVLDLDKAAIDRLNGLDEALTVATLPAYAPVEPGQMVATVKVIPFAVPEAAVAAVESVAGASGCLRVAPWLGLEFGLVQTVLPGMKPSVLDKTVDVTRGRVAAVGGTLLRERRVSHTADQVAEALAELAESGRRALLVAGASAITDRRDVLPTAIERAGGHILHFGMPVDPGNLLLLAELRGAPVLGLPGCARSPRLNGFDWVLQRLAAGLPVGRAEVMRMGVGGLLADVPRPLPRAQVPTLPRAPRIAALMLAAGLSRRMGFPKLLAELDGKPLIRHAVEAALASQAAPVLVVVGHRADEVRLALTGLPVTFVPAADHADGLSASLKAGLAALPAQADGVVVMLGDMPRVVPGTVDRLIAAYAPSEGRTICVPVQADRRGNPVLWDRQFVAEMLDITGDAGAKVLLTRHADSVVEVPVDDTGIHLDVDTTDALEGLRARTAGP